MIRCEIEKGYRETLNTLAQWHQEFGAGFAQRCTTARCSSRPWQFAFHRRKGLAVFGVWGLDPDDVITAWVALTDANAENGYMQFLPGSHKVDQLPHVDTFHKDNLLSRGQEIAVEVDKSKGVGVELKAGEMSLHHIKLVHGSEPNRSADRRIGLAIRYIPTYVRQTKVRDAAMLVRGTDRFRHFDYEPRPQKDLDEGAMAAHADSVARQVKALYAGTDKQAFRA